MLKLLMKGLLRKGLSTMWRLTDEQFQQAGGKLGRILGLTGSFNEDYQDLYRHHIWVFAAVNAIIRNVAMVPLVFQTKEGPIDPNSNHPFIKLFEKPNRWQGFGQFMESMIGWWHVNGECMIVMRRNSFKDIPIEMAAVDGTPFQPVLNDAGRLIGWQMEGGDGEPIPFALHEVIHLKFWDPENEWRGLSPISAALAGLKQDFLASQYNNEFFRNSGIPGGVIEMDDNLTTEEFNELVRQYDDRHGGVNNAHKMLILEGGMKFKSNVSTQKDIEFLKQKQWTRDEILAAFGVPKMEVGIIEEGANLAVIKMQSREFWQKNLIPKLNLISWLLWAELFSNINNGQVWAEFDLSEVQAIQDDYKEKVETGRKLWEMGYTANQINKRLALGMPDNSWQNTPFMQFQMTPLQIDAEGRPVVPDTNPPGKDPLTPPPTGPTVEEVEGTGTGEPKPPAAERRLTPQQQKLKAFFFRQRARQLKALSENPINVLDTAHEAEHLKTYLAARELPYPGPAIQNLIASKMWPNVILHRHEPETLLQKTKEIYNQVEKLILSGEGYTEKGGEEVQ